MVVDRNVYFTIKIKNTPIRGLSTIFKKRMGPNLSCREVGGIWKGWFRRLETKED